MKISIKNAGDYKGLVNVEFPVTVEVKHVGYALYYVAYEEISKIPGWFFHKDDTFPGEDYCFWPETEAEVVPTTEQNQRKDALNRLVTMYGEALMDIVYASANGTVEEWTQAQERKDDLREKIAKMIEEGV